MTALRPSDASDAGLPATVRRRWPILVLLALVVAMLLGGWLGFSYLFLRPAAPAAVGLAGASTTPSATSSVDAATASPVATASRTVSAEVGGAVFDGTWNVDSSIGSFSDFSGSFVGYRVQEELANIGAATAVGRTPNVTGSLTFDGSTVTGADFTADLSTLQSDRPQRDGQLRRQALETGTYPTATFKLTQPMDLGTVPADGQVIESTATGDLTIHGTTKSVQIPVEARVSGDVVTVTGSTDILFADYGISRPQSFMVLSIADRGTMEFQLQFTKA